MCRTDPKNKYVCITCRIGKHTTHRKDTGRALTQTGALNYQKGAWAEGGTACCGLLQTWHKYTQSRSPKKIVRAFVTDLQQVKCALRLSGFFYGITRGRAGHCVYAAWRVCCPPALIASIQNQFERVNVGHSGVKRAQQSVSVWLSKLFKKIEKKRVRRWWGRLERIVRII